MSTITMTDYQARFLDQLTEDIKEIKDTVKSQGQLLNKIHRQTIRTNGRVTELEKDAAPTKKDLPNPWKDPAIIKTVLMIILAIVLGLTGIRVAGLAL